MLNIFICLLPISMSSSEKCLMSSAQFYVRSLMSCMSSLNILDINILQDMSLMNVFYHLVACLFVLLVVSFTAQKPFSPICLFLLLCPLFQGTYPKRYCSDWCQTIYYDLFFILRLLWFILNLFLCKANWKLTFIFEHCDPLILTCFFLLHLC